MQTVDNQHVWSLNTWCGILGTQIIGPYFFEGHLNGQMYRDFLQNELPLLLDDVPLDIRNNMVFQQDGAPAHYSAQVRAELDRMFPQRWIGRGSQLRPWPARSPDLTPLDFYPWGKVKDEAYFNRPESREEMKQKIKDICANVPASELNAVDRNFRRRLQKCIDQQGGIFEHI